MRIGYMEFLDFIYDKATSFMAGVLTKLMLLR